MLKIAVVVALAVGLASALTLVERRTSVAVAAAEAGAAALVAAADRADEDNARMRVCVGPARVNLGGQPFVRLAFGGEGCGGSIARVVGVRLLSKWPGARGSSASPGVPMHLGFGEIR